MTQPGKRIHSDPTANDSSASARVKPIMPVWSYNKRCNRHADFPNTEEILITRPPGDRHMAQNRLVIKYMPFRLVSMMSNHFESSESSIGLSPEMPALLTKM